MEHKYEKWISILKKIRDRIDSVLTVIFSAVALFILITTSGFLINLFTGGYVSATTVSLVLILLVSISLASRSIVSYLRRKINQIDLDTQLKNLKQANGTDNSDRGHSRDDSGTGQSSEQNIADKG